MESTWRDGEACLGLKPAAVAARIKLAMTCTPGVVLIAVSNRMQKASLKRLVVPSCADSDIVTLSKVHGLHIGKSSLQAREEGIVVLHYLGFECKTACLFMVGMKLLIR